MSFRILYGEAPGTGSGTEPGRQDAASVIVFVNAFTKALGLKKVDFELHKVIAISRRLSQFFPTAKEMAIANPFKKVAYFVCEFCADKPFPEPFFPLSGTIEEAGATSQGIQIPLAKIPNHQNAMVAYAFGVTALVNASIARTNGDTVILSNKILVSQHSYVDIIEALAQATPSTSYHLVTMLFEQLSYRANPHASYTCVI